MLLVLSACMPATAVLSDRPASRWERPLARLQVRGDRIVAGGKPVRLRGINWGWWQLAGTVYGEREMRRVAGWGANLIRLAFDAAWLEASEGASRWNEEGFRRIDEVLGWARRYGVRVVLDMHVAPGGQNPTPYTVGGANRLWTDEAAQRRFEDLWREIARRYRKRPEVAAYELMNEPETKGLAPPGALRSVLLRGLRAIRAVDGETIVVVGGDGFSAAGALVDEIVLPVPNVLYTFHFYEPGRLTWQSPAPGCGYPDDVVTQERWLRNTSEGPGLAGAGDWRRIEHTFTAPQDAVEAAVLLRSTANAGTAWFDDVRVERDDDGALILAAGFARDPEGFTPERPPMVAMAWDGGTGRGAGGSLRVRETPEHTGWVSPRFRVVPGRRYRVSAWVRLEDATGDTYLSVALFGGRVERVDRAWLRRAIEPAVRFSRSHRVPVWVGEFGCAACARPEGSQARWVRDCIDVFEDAGFHWTYWNYRETTGPHSMALHPHDRQGNAWLNQPLLSELRRGWTLRDAERPSSRQRARTPARRG